MRNFLKIKSISFILLLVCEILIVSNVYATEVTFEDARQAAFNGRREQAITMCQNLIDTDPKNFEVRTFLGRLYSWNDQYEKAHEQFNFVLEARPQNTDAREGLADLELWNDKPQNALEVIDAGLVLNPNSPELLTKRGKVLRILRKENYLNKATFSYTHDQLTEDFDPWNIYSISLAHQFDFGSVTARVNRANRFQTDGTQFELDAYPRLRPGTYFYLNAGTSKDSIFPRQRYGFEVYQSLGSAWEASFGIRYLEFTSTIVRLYTATLGKYWGDYYFVFRTNMVPDESRNSLSGRLEVRRYFDSESYVSASVSAGRSPTFAASVDDFVVLRSQAMTLDLYHSLTESLLGSIGLGYSSDEIRPNVFRNDASISLSLEKRF